VRGVMIPEGPTGSNAITLDAMFAAHLKYRLFESVGFVGPYPAFADSDDFDALRVWAVHGNDWKGERTAAIVVSDEGSFWKVFPDGSFEPINASQAEAYASRLAGRWSPRTLEKMGYDVPGPESARGQHETIHVGAFNSPEVQDALDAIDEVGHPRRTRPPTRLTTAENKAIEQHAVDLVRRHFEAEHYTTTDVGATESYDIYAVKADHEAKIEVKGTTSDGSEIVLTYNEVELHKAEHPNNALAVVKRIILDRTGPTARGGELQLLMPWDLRPERLRPIAYRYHIGG
jgi:hypothetical protein